MFRLSNRILAALALFALPAFAQNEMLQTESFDKDPGWDGLNNRSETPKRTIVQNFGYAAGEAPSIGGSITPDGSPAYYAKEIPATDLNKPLSASGTIRVEKGGGNLLLGFFNASTVNEWRTPNSMVFRFNGRGDIFHTHIEYATSKWRAGAGIIGKYDSAADRNYPIEIPSEGVHKWSMDYDPAAADGRGIITVTLDDQKALCTLAEGHKADGAVFNRFGLLNVVKHADSPGTVWVADLTINGEKQDLSSDPHWDALRNRETYETEEVRPRFNFGFSPTQYAKGTASGELGGLFFRGDCRYPDRLAYYGARLETLTLAKPMQASGKLALRRAVSDSTTLFGFFHSEHSVLVNPAQSDGLPANFLGFAIEGPSSEGFYAYPVFRTQGNEESGSVPAGAKHVYPDGEAHTWALEYKPPASDAPGALALTLDGTRVEVPVPAGSEATEFDRFGLVTPWIDGNGQVVYFDDLAFTARQ